MKTITSYTCSFLYTIITTYNFQFFFINAIYFDPLKQHRCYDLNTEWCKSLYKYT